MKSKFSLSYVSCKVTFYSYVLVSLRLETISQLLKKVLDYLSYDCLQWAVFEFHNFFFVVGDFPIFFLEVSDFHIFFLKLSISIMPKLAISIIHMSSKGGRQT